MELLHLFEAWRSGPDAPQLLSQNHTCILIQKNEERHQGFKRHSEQMMKNIGQNEVIQKKCIDCERPLQVVD